MSSCFLQSKSTLVSVYASVCGTISGFGERLARLILFSGSVKSVTSFLVLHLVVFLNCPAHFLTLLSLVVIERSSFQAGVVVKCKELDLTLINTLGVPEKQEKKKQVASNIGPALPEPVLSILAISYG